MVKPAISTIQIGSGGLQRGLVNLPMSIANAEGTGVGKAIVAVSYGVERAEAFNRQKGKFHVAVQGTKSGEMINDIHVVDSVDRALVMSDSEQWFELLSIAADPNVKFLNCNTAEEGYKTDKEDHEQASKWGKARVAPITFPGKLLHILRQRFEKNAGGLRIFALELREKQADELLSIVLELAEKWNWPANFIKFVKTECHFHNTLVDRIVPLERPEKHGDLTFEDQLLTGAEPYALFGIESDDSEPVFYQHESVTYVEDISKLFLRKFRILNGSHTASVCWQIANGRPHTYVRESMQDSTFVAWLETMIAEDIVPLVIGRTDGAEDFAKDVLDRFRNPFSNQTWEMIERNHGTKVADRLWPIFEESQSMFGRKPEHMSKVVPAELLAS
jgi:tagaturonate reductase